jgi:hypothetical protein
MLFYYHTVCALRIERFGFLVVFVLFCKIAHEIYVKQSEYDFVEKQKVKENR